MHKNYLKFEINLYYNTYKIKKFNNSLKNNQFK